MFTLLTLSLRRDYFEKTKRGPFSTPNTWADVSASCVTIGCVYGIRSEPTSPYFLDIIVDRATNDLSCVRVGFWGVLELR